MDPVRILRLETLGFLVVLAALLAYRMLTRQINLSGLLGDGINNGQVSPERVQLLLATMALSLKFLQGSLHSGNGVMADISPQWLMIFGTSSGLYATVKGFKVWRAMRTRIQGLEGN